MFYEGGISPSIEGLVQERNERRGGKWERSGRLMNAKWYLFGAIVLGVLVFLYLFLWCADPCH